MSLRPDFQPRREQDPDPLDLDVEMAEFDELMVEHGLGSWEASQVASWLTSVAGPPEGSQARTEAPRGPK